VRAEPQVCSTLVIREAKKTPKEALEAGVLSDADMKDITEMNNLVAQVVAVDEYTPKELAARFPDNSVKSRKDFNALSKEAAE